MVIINKKINYTKTIKIIGFYPEWNSLTWGEIIKFRENRRDENKKLEKCLICSNAFKDEDKTVLCIIECSTNKLCCIDCYNKHKEPPTD